MGPRSVREEGRREGGKRDAQGGGSREKQEINFGNHLGRGWQPGLQGTGSWEIQTPCPPPTPHPQPPDLTALGSFSCLHQIKTEWPVYCKMLSMRQVIFYGLHQNHLMQMLLSWLHFYRRWRTHSLKIWMKE